MAASDSPRVLLGSASAAGKQPKLAKQPRSVSLFAPRPHWLPDEGPGQQNVAPERWALRLDQLVDFVKACKKTDAWHAICSRRGCVSIADVNKSFVVPWTQGLGNSIALLMNGAAPLKSELMISHAWGEDADELLEALELYSAQHDLPMSVAAFFCTFSLYQPGDQARGGMSIADQVALAPFKKVIEAHPSMGMVVVHTTAQDVYTRMWCVHEVDEALEASVPVSGVLSQRFRAKFIGQASEELLDLRTEQAACSDPGDEAMLREAILKKPGSFRRLDEVILAFRRKMFEAEERAFSQQVPREVTGRSLCEQSLRAVTGGSLLRAGARALRLPETQATHEASSPVVEIDCFVSHSQQAGWASKAWALLLTATVMPAVLLGCLCHAAVLFLDFQMITAGDGMSSTPFHNFKTFFLSNESDAPVPVSFTLDFAISCVVIVAAVFAAPHLPGLVGRTFFVDKCCVAKDAEAQLRALLQVRSVLKSSKKMVLLWTPEYFDSLKCVHELATFLHVHQGHHNVQVVPACIPIFTVALFFFHLFATMALVVLAPLTIGSFQHQSWIADNVPCEWRYLYVVACLFGLCFFGLYLAPAFVFWKFAEWYMGQRKRLQKQLSGFSVANSRCFLEAHRAALLADIGERFGSVAAFERFIQQELPQQIPLLRRAPVPLSTAMVAAIAHLFFCSMGILHAVHAENDAVAWHASVSLPLIWVCVDSIALNLVMLLAGRGLSEDGGPSPRSRRRLLGPLATAVIFAGLQAISLGTVFPVIPLSGAFAILVVMAVAVVALYNYSFDAGEIAAPRELPPAEGESKDPADDRV